MTFPKKARTGSATVALLLTSCMVFPAAGFAQQRTAPPSYDKIPATKPATPNDNAAKAPEPATKGGDETKAAESGDAAKTANTGKDAARDAAKDQRETNREAFFSARLAALHAGLALNADQEPLWAPVESAIRDLAKTHGRRRSREEVANLLNQTPSDLLRMRSEQLLKRGEAIKALVDATGPLVDKLDDAQKGRLPLLLQGMRPAFILRAAFDIRYGRVVDDPDDEGASKSRDRAGMSGDHDSDDHDSDGRMDRRHHDHGSHAERDDDRPGARFDDGRGDPTPRQGQHEQHGDDDDRT